MIGRLNKSVTLKSRVEANDRGTVYERLSTLGTAWAEILPSTSREAYRAVQAQPELEYVVRMRERNDLNSQCVVVWGSRTLELLGPPMQVEIDGTRLLELHCAEVDES